MSEEIDPTMPGMIEAMRRLDEIEAADAAEKSKPASTATAEPSANSEPSAAQGEGEPAPKPDSQPSDTPAATEPAATPTEGKKEEPPKSAEAVKAADDKSRYSKAQERLTKTWDAVNAEKTTIATEKAALEQSRQQFAQEKAKFDLIQKQAEQPQHTPEDYVKASQMKRNDADALRTQARRAEDAGNFEQAEKLTKQANKLDALADDMAEHAETIRKNPPQGFAERSKQYEQAKQAWTMEAAKAFPDLAKQGSEFQRTVAGHLNALTQQDPNLLVNPSVIYHVSRLTAAELKVQQLNTVAARVPVLEKELEQFKAKVKELQALTTPGGSSVIPKLGSPSADDDEEALYREAAGMALR